VSKLILITGAAAGIGRAAALLALARGHRVVALDRDHSALDALVSGHVGCVAAAADVSDGAALRAAVAQAVEELGVPDAAICSAGIDVGGPSHSLGVDEWDRVLEINLRGTFLTCREVIGGLLRAGQPGALVCVSSPFAFVGAPGGTAAYSASKGGISALVRSLAVEYADAGIRVNAVVPGATETELMWSSVPRDERDAMRALVRTEIPLGRLARPEEPAAAALWLLSDEASFVTGSHLVCDGGTLARSSISV
jgi:NAD(P)-dependent dehydrogenase (short-subunit alcohol dehydrogenase family)